MSHSDLPSLLLRSLRSSPQGIPQDSLPSLLPFKEHEIADALNELIAEGRVAVVEGCGGAVFRYRSEKEASKFREMSKEEADVYETVIASGGTGISTNDIKNKVRIDNTTFINKILLKLSKKFLIRSLKVLNTKNKKVWIGYEVEPSQEITGGIWCVNQEFDKNLIKVFCEKLLEKISAQSSSSRKELLLYAKSVNLMQNSSEIREEDIQKIVNVLIFDGKIEPIFPEDLSLNFLDNKYSLLFSRNEPSLENVKYRRRKEYICPFSFESVPCGLCPNADECKKDNLVNPMECPHLDKFVEDISQK